MFSIMLVHLCQPPQGPNYLWISGVEGKGQKMQADAKFYFQAQLSSITIISIAARICLKWRVPPATLLGKSLHCLWTLDAIIRTSREVSSVDIQAQSTPVTWVKEVPGPTRWLLPSAPKYTLLCLLPSHKRITKASSDAHQLILLAILTVLPHLLTELLFHI